MVQGLKYNYGENLSPEVVKALKRQERKKSAFQGPISYTLALCAMAKNKRRGGKLSKLDAALINALLERLSPEHREVAASNVEEANFADTVHYGNKSETIFRKVRPFAFDLTREKEFSFEYVTVRLAALKFRCKDQVATVKFYCIRNKLTNISYDCSTEKLSSQNDVEILDADMRPRPEDDFGNPLT